MSVAPELARLTASVLPGPRPFTTDEAGPEHARQGSQETAQAAAWTTMPVGPSGRPGALTLGTLARGLRVIAATPERWWGLVRFEPDRPVDVPVEEGPGYQAWLVVMPPQDAGRRCGCDVATMIAGEATEGTPQSPVLRAGSFRTHGAGHLLRGQGPGYAISLHVRAR
jgi:hypothetical protein